VNTFAWEAGKCSGLDRKLCELRAATGDRIRKASERSWGVGLDGRESDRAGRGSHPGGLESFNRVEWLIAGLARQ
jgi:hypothetical protein